MSNYQEVIQSLKKGVYAPMYFLYGEEPYYIDKVSDYIEGQMLDEMAREFDQLVLYGKDYERDMSPIISAARRFPMMGRQVIIVKEAQNIRSWAPLELYLQQVVQTTTLVFCYKYGKPDKRLKVFKDFEKAGGVMMESPLVADYQLGKWILDYIKDWNKEQLSSQEAGEELTIDETCVVVLAESLGNDLQKIVNELNKLIQGRPAGVNRITPELVEKYIGISKDFNIFELQKALIDGDVQKANKIVRYFSQSKSHPLIKELSTLFGFFQNLMIYHYLPDKSEYAAASVFGISPFIAKNYVAAARRFSAGKTFRIIGYFREIDAKSKGFNCPTADDASLWKELIYKILH